CSPLPNPWGPVLLAKVASTHRCGAAPESAGKRPHRTSLLNISLHLNREICTFGGGNIPLRSACVNTIAAGSSREGWRLGLQSIRSTAPLRPCSSRAGKLRVDRMNPGSMAARLLPGLQVRHPMRHMPGQHVLPGAVDVVPRVVEENVGAEGFEE